MNAGLGVLGHSLELDPDDVDRMIDINVRGPYHAAVDAARNSVQPGPVNPDLNPNVCCNA